MNLRIGHGYDIHRLIEGRRLVLGGVPIDFHLGLDGHSDADVICHAAMDALLGALAMGDIGRHFPTDDPAYKGADSIELLKRVKHMISNQGYAVVNIDISVIAEKPKLAPYIGRMRSNLAGALEIESDRVSIKATTNENIGLVGRGEGIAAFSVVLLSK
ncbi:MAG: 2-C-methyl-D-erythritol 2,4-cyclodiphosphate synthase [candidate division Zixibacteria bacterium RBG_16_53_22]|nr:MAG: 2-C-methyl-D-erythritol 2,4-cyclodiphosphate synthase [candidate division Zixibacteria bacterium RBG_16_53_22]